MSRTVKLALMGAGAAAVLYSCASATGGMGALPFLWFLGNPFNRSQVTTTCPPGNPTCQQQATGSSSSSGSGGSSFRSGSSSGTADAPAASPSSTSQRGGFGSSGSTGSS
jgi:hypothetical protein